MKISWVDLAHEDKDSNLREEIYEEIESDEDIQAMRKTLENPPPQTKKGFKCYECPICFDNPEVIAVIPCGHMYCSDCVFKAIAVKGNCSICRKNVTYKQVKFLEVRIRNPNNVTEWFSTFRMNFMIYDYNLCLLGEGELAPIVFFFCNLRNIFVSRSSKSIWRFSNNSCILHLTVNIRISCAKL